MLADQPKSSSSVTQDTPIPILLDYQGSICTVTLNRPKSLNAINIEMVRLLRPELDKWNESSSLKAVIFKGSGDRAFSSGGDMLRVYKSKIGQAPDDYPEHFFRESYTLDFLIAQMNPVQITFWDGIVMGGGVGISVHAPICIATENAVFAMPEAKVGLFTDVGSGYFLSRLKKNLGYFLGLTAIHLKGHELVQVGVADYFVKRENLLKLEQEIIQTTNSSTTLQDLRDIVKKYEEPIDQKYPNEDLIDELFGKESLENIYNALNESDTHKEFTQKLLDAIDIMCPLSLRIVFEQLKRGKELDLRENLQMDRRLMMRILARPDPGEGVRCTLLERGSKPNWSHKSIFEISQEEVEKEFEKLESHREIL